MQVKSVIFKKYKFLWLCLSVTLLLIFNCSRGAKEKKGKFEKFYRIIEHLSEKNIVQTPFKDIIKKFRLLTENITQWQYIPELSDKMIETWIFSTSYPVLGDDAAIPGEEIRLLENGETVK